MIERINKRHKAKARRLLNLLAETQLNYSERKKIFVGRKGYPHHDVYEATRVPKTIMTLLNAVQRVEEATRNIDDKSTRIISVPIRSTLVKVTVNPIGTITGIDSIIRGPKSPFRNRQNGLGGNRLRTR